MSKQEIAIVSADAIIASLLIIEVKTGMHELPYTDPEFVGVLVMFFHSLAYFLLISSIVNAVFYCASFTFYDRLTTRLIKPTRFLLLGLVCYIVQLVIYTPQKFFFQKDVEELPSDYNTALFVAYAVPQYSFVLLMLCYSLYVTEIVVT